MCNRKGLPWERHEDKILRDYAGKKTAPEIAVILDRPTQGVHHRMKHLKLSGRIIGENHWNAKITNLQCQMIIVLYAAGFSINEIQAAAFNHVSVRAVNDLVSARTRKTA